MQTPIKTAVKSMFFCGLVMLFCVSAAAWADATSLSAAVEKRTAPVGEVCMQGQPCAAAAVAEVGGAPKSGEEIYKQTCHTCHEMGVAGAPKLGDAAAWNARLASSGGEEGLHKHAIGGFKGMPAKGLCFNCSDAEIFSAVDYMLSKAK